MNMNRLTEAPPASVSFLRGSTRRLHRFKLHMSSSSHPPRLQVGALLLRRRLETQDYPVYRNILLNYPKSFNCAILDTY
ncbi:hypothetical protein F2Q68_00012063 [Brassica cretica]|uniref:Uncharacterized protein n=1 Tax=Brassica cretica TaxID=69181 RepID=A0A8S9L1J4_BRACR|nr:hypothetical protein F2Q68_00012063 [Brassica cretica]